MKTVLLACTFAAVALSVIGAPAFPSSEEDEVLRQYPENYQYLQREPRSQYSPQYALPCAAAAAANPIHGYASPYQFNVPSFAQFGYGGQHYRSADPQMAEPEMLAFSDMGQIPARHGMLLDHVPMARNGYAAPISPLAPGLALNGPVLTSAGGAAYGIFPNANVGGCNIPLLFSCSPSISSGRLVESQGHYASGPAIPVAAAANSYRLVEDQPHHVVPEHSGELFEQHIDPVHEATQDTKAHT